MTPQFGCIISMQTQLFVRCPRSIVGLAVAAAIFFGAGPLCRAATKTDANATQLTQALYTNLRALQASNSTAFGEQFGTWQGVNADGSGWQGDFNRSDIKSMTGSHPAMTGWNIQTYLSLSPVGQSTFVQRVKDDFNRNTIIGFHWTMNNPISGGPDTDTTGVGQTPSVLARAVTVAIPNKYYYYY